MTVDKQVLISGGGPSGLAAAIMFHQRGWRDIVLVEQTKSFESFVRGKAFNYLIDGRGQTMLDHIGIGEDQLNVFGTPNDVFTLVSAHADGKVSSMSPPVHLKDRKTPYWTARSQLLNMLYTRLVACNSDGRIKLLLDHKFDGVSDKGDAIVVTSSDGDAKRFTPDLILGCDGLNSAVRKDLAAAAQNPSDYEMVRMPSPASQLIYKVVRLPSTFGTVKDPNLVDNHEFAYAFYPNYKRADEKFRLFSLPVSSPEEPRSANIILPKDHKFWSLKTSDEIGAFLKAGFPQLDIDTLIPKSELDSFAEMAPGGFPDPQYSPKIFGTLSLGEKTTPCVLIGDAAHAFPPDLGLGVNSALEDVYLFGGELDAAQEDAALAAKSYDKNRTPDNRALVRMVKSIFPYQYNQKPWRLGLYMLKFLTQINLHKVSGGLIDPPPFMLTQEHKTPFREIERRYKMTDATFFAFLAVVIAAIAWGVSALI